MKSRGAKGGGSLRLTGENALAALQARGRPLQVRQAAIDRLLKPDTPDYAPYIVGLLNTHGLGAHPFREDYKFHPNRGWEIDYAWPQYLVGLEIDGGIFTGGAHGSIEGKLRDIEKGNALLMFNWRVIHCVPQELGLGMALVAELIKRQLSMMEAPRNAREAAQPRRQED